ncbi:hypothetical protein K3495_g12819 [Podosphaera aphanis]|nr:hypothetical protein K3495_g12819 [Podosphaera aphanis]
MKAVPIDMIIPDVKKPIDTLITDAYLKSSIATAMINSLKNKNCKRWPKDLQKYLRKDMIDCKLVGNWIYRRDKLFLPPDDELKNQVLYRTHSTGPGGHPGRTKTFGFIDEVVLVAEYVKRCSKLC